MTPFVLVATDGAEELTVAPEVGRVAAGRDPALVEDDDSPARREARAEPCRSSAPESDGVARRRNSG